MVPIFSQPVPLEDSIAPTTSKDPDENMKMVHNGMGIIFNAQYVCKREEFDINRYEALSGIFISYIVSYCCEVPD